MSMALNSPLIISFSASGEGVRLLSKYKPQAKIIAICYDPKVSSHLQMVRGVKCYIVPNFNNSEDIIKDVIKNEKNAKIG
jgi:pyruvate kinase